MEPQDMTATEELLEALASCLYAAAGRGQEMPPAPEYVDKLIAAARHRAAARRGNPVTRGTG